MRFLKILGMVVALHVVLFTIFLLSPGCQSNPTTPAPTPAVSGEPTDATDTLAATPVDEQENWTSPRAAASTRTPAPSGGSNSVSSTISSAPLPGSANDGGRAAPARPSNPESYVSTGDTPPPALNPPPTTHIVRAGDSFTKIAAKYGTTATALQKANPGVKPQSMRIGQEIKLPASISAPRTGSTSAAAAPTSSSGSRYTVRAGDSLSAIAARNGTTVTALRQANNLRNDIIQVGQELIVPGGTSQAPAAARSNDDAPAAPRRAAGTISGDASTATVEHTLRSGETLGALAKRYGVSTDAIIAANNISDPRKIRAGQKLVIPGQRAAGTPQQTAPAPAQAAPAPQQTAPATESEPLPPTDSLPPPEPLVPADMTDAPPIPVDEPVPTP